MQRDSSRILRIAAWIWVGYLLAMAVMDFVLYAQLSAPFPGAPLPGANPLLPPLDPRPFPGPRFTPVILYYAANGLVAAFLLFFAHWDWIQERLGRDFLPLLLVVISAAPILINVLVVPRFPNGPLANAEGMALRQMPFLFVALALTAWEYPLSYIVVYSLSVSALDLGLIHLTAIDTRNVSVFVFIAAIRTLSFLAVGAFISALVTRLREQGESLRRANADLTHFASTLEQLTVSRERNRLARELHDTLAHSLTAISVSLETAKAYFEIDPPRARELLETSLESTRLGVEETRRALKALRSNALEDLGLGLAIRRAAESAASRARLDLDLSLPDPMPSLSPDVEQAILRIAQEAIENAAHHSAARRIRVRLATDGLTTLIVEDDGAGFDVREKEKSGHFGLVGMRERAELAGGRLKIESRAGQGTKVELTI